MESTLKKTSNPVIIRRWTEARGGHPARVVATPDPSALGISFDEREATLELIGWESFFNVIHKRELDFVYEEVAKDGSKSRFYKFVERKHG